MKIGKVLFMIIVALVILTGIYVAITKTKGAIEVKKEQGNEFINSLLWFMPRKFSTSTNSNATVQFPQAKIEEQKKEIPAEPTPVPPAGYQVKDLSPFYKKVRIRSVTPANRFNYSMMNGFQLAAEGNNTKPIFITGWKITGNNKSEIYIPQAISDYKPSGLSTRDAIKLDPGAVANFYSTQSPMGENLRLNLCTGYLNSRFGFSPALPNMCPTPYDRGEVIASSAACQNFLFSLGGCDEVSPSQRNQFFGSNDTTCRAVLDRFTYGYCYAKNRNKPEFFSKEWRVWFGIPMPFEPSHDRVLLYDNGGLIVDEYVY